MVSDTFAIPFFVLKLYFDMLRNKLDLEPKRPTSSSKKKRGIFEQIFKLLASRLLGVPLAFFSNLLFARLLGPDKYGTYMFYLSVALVAAGFSVLGSDKIVIRELANCTVRHRKSVLEDLKSWLVQSQIATLLTSAFVFSIWFVVELIRDHTYDYSVIVAFLIVPVYTWTILTGSVLAGYSHTSAGQSLDSIIKNAVLLIVALAAYGSHCRVIVLFLASQAIAYLIAMSFGLFYYRTKICPNELNFEVSVADYQRQSRSLLMSSSFTFFIAGAAITLMGRLDLILVQMVGTSRDVGLFGAANRLAQIGNIVPMAMLFMLQPIFAKSASQTTTQINNELKKSRFWTLSLTCGLVVPAILFAPELMNIMGRGFVPATLAFRVLMIAYLLSSMSLPDYAYLSMSRREKLVAKINWLQFFLTAIITISLVPAYGATGASLGYAVGTAVASSLFVYFSVLCRKEDLTTSPFKSFRRKATDAK